ncbi:MAG: hypothetical protein HN674_04205 [Candidatus Marinimicrobia bacterium]|jgi:hypothetical protein|nr:hypothetical protein [Candidatus Neomarinimicrobiota bacterium]MBT3839880.1 hypothetical protein [Candidatus Neomarinimicrobiota bacterium]MBT3999611.1 hypothetical protein [Candidatus Neomarinimicrobiota bacterium]MBT4383293.1 hypothetical protein [Candidatus Neomarinimicrobiota bacterium]MBT4580012.1 hypothetical protein [Candidatus Neomarinimicrobiota bacterium]
MKSLSSFIKIYRKQIFGWILAITIIGVALYFGIDKKIILFVTFVVSIFTQIFVGLGALVGMIPFIGPLIIKAISIPVFWFLNAMGYVVSGVAIKKGYATELAKSRIVTLGLLIGIIIGYILGHLIPLR